MNIYRRACIDGKSEEEARMTLTEIPRQCLMSRMEKGREIAKNARRERGSADETLVWSGKENIFRRVNRPLSERKGEEGKIAERFPPPFLRASERRKKEN